MKKYFRGSAIHYVIELPIKLYNKLYQKVRIDATDMKEITVALINYGTGKSWFRRFIICVVSVYCKENLSHKRLANLLTTLSLEVFLF